MKETIFSIAFSIVLAMGFFWLMGGSLETLATGKWIEIDDHPTNYYDTSQHPTW